MTPMSALPPLSALENPAEFIARHIGPGEHEQQHMLRAIGAASRAALIEAVMPASIRRREAMRLPPPASEAQALAELAAIAAKNRVLRSCIGRGYHGTLTPAVILRNVLENPAWYTAYTPYQAEISQGRLEALVNFQTLVCDLTGMAVANASMLDEATAAAEAMTLARRSVKARGQAIVVAGDCHPQTLEVVRTRAQPLGIEVRQADSAAAWDALLAADDYFAVLVSYPATHGRIDDWHADVARVHGKQAAFIVCADLLALTLLRPPGEWGADVVVGSTQRFGMPMGAGGPHAAYMACRDEFKRSLPGRLVGVSVDAHGQPAYRLALQTREQHIRREKATSNICTNSGLMSLAFTIHMTLLGEKGLRHLARLNHARACETAERVSAIPGVTLLTERFFNEFAVELPVPARQAVRDMAEMGVLGGVSAARLFPGLADMEKILLIAVTETVSRGDIDALVRALTEILGSEYPGA